MMQFTMCEVIRSLVCGTIYGIAFFFFYTVILLLISQFGRFYELPVSIVKYDNFFEKTIKNGGRNSFSLKSPLIFFLAILFAIGFVLLSYYALDGCLRIYLFMVSVFTFLVLRKILFNSIYTLLDIVFEVLFYVVSITLRIVFFPFLHLFLYFRDKKINFYK